MEKIIIEMVWIATICLAYWLGWADGEQKQKFKYNINIMKALITELENNQNRK